MLVKLLLLAVTIFLNGQAYTVESAYVPGDPNREIVLVSPRTGDTFNMSRTTWDSYDPACAQGNGKTLCVWTENVTNWYEELYFNTHFDPTGWRGALPVTGTGVDGSGQEGHVYWEHADWFRVDYTVPTDSGAEYKRAYYNFATGTWTLSQPWDGMLPRAWLPMASASAEVER